MATPSLFTFEIELYADNPEFSPRLRTFEIEAGPVEQSGVTPRVRTFEIEAGAIEQSRISPRVRTFEIEADLDPLPPADPLTVFRQQNQVRASDDYSDVLALGDAESTAAHLQDDLNFLRSVFKDFLGTVNWNDAPTQDMEALAAETTADTKLVLYRVQNFTDVSVPTSQNYVALTSVPTEDIAISASTIGAVVAQLAGPIGAHSLDAAASNRNIVHIRSAASNQKIFDGGREIFGLLQVGSAATDGNLFASSGDDQPQISFVTVNHVTEALEAANVAAIENQTIEYAYLVRNNLRDMPEGAFDPTFVSGSDAASSGATLDTAYNSGSQVTADAGDVEWRVGSGRAWKVADSAGAVSILEVTDSGASTSVNSTADWDINVVQDVDVSGGLSVDTDNSALTMDNGLISRSSGLSVTASTGALNLTSAVNLGVEAGAEVQFDDSRVTQFPLSDVGNTTLYGGAASLLGAINNAGASGGAAVTIGRVSVNSGVAANTIVTAADVTPLTDAPNGLVPYTNAAQFTDDLWIFLNGILMAPGATSGANNDVYPAGVAANGEMAFEFDLLAGDVLTVVKLG